jgi:Holliday junction DNA helicase RuvA
LCNVISSGNDKLLKGVKGIGLKTAQRIIVDLKDKIATTGMETVAGSVATLSPAHSEVYDEAIAALTMLGFAQAPSQKVVTAILKEEPGLTVEKVIKLALKRL